MKYTFTIKEAEELFPGLKEMPLEYPMREKVYDEKGKDMTHPQYGKQADWISERNKKQVGEKNPNWTGSGVVTLGRKEYDRRRDLEKREEILERCKKYQKAHPEVSARACKKYYERRKQNGISS